MQSAYDVSHAMDLADKIIDGSKNRNEIDTHKHDHI